MVFTGNNFIVYFFAYSDSRCSTNELMDNSDYSVDINAVFALTDDTSDYKGVLSSLSETKI